MDLMMSPLYWISADLNVHGKSKRIIEMVHSVMIHLLSLYHCKIVDPVGTLEFNML